MAPWLQQVCQGGAGVACLVVAATLLGAKAEYQLAVAGFGLALIANAIKGPNQVSLVEHKRAVEEARAQSVPPPE